MKGKVKVGWVGVGRRAHGMLKNIFSVMDDVEITAICDIDEAGHGGMDWLVRRAFIEAVKTAQIPPLMPMTQHSGCQSGLFPRHQSIRAVSH